MEEILKGGNREIGVGLIDLSEDRGVNTVDGSLIDLIIRNLALEILGSARVSREGQDVGVVAEEEDLLLG